jgi:glyoxylase-like metal-dependent hydrolase (beta-lactamase superfamily II)
MYEPTPFRSTSSRFLVEPSSGIAGRYALPGVAPAPAPSGATIRGPQNAGRPSLRATPNDRPMDPWVVLREWTQTPNVTIREECYYRDFWRAVASRARADGVVERLFIDSKSGFPVKLERREPHSLFGDVLVEYLWTTWMKVGSAAAPRSVFRLEDRVLERAWTHSSYAMVERDSVAELLAGGTATPAALPRPAAWDVVDTVRVNATTFLLKSPIYTNVVSLQRDTVFILDAQQGEARARADSAWIGKLFPGRHPIALVVTDLAWPHIAGVRFWVAHGVSVVTHRLSKTFLDEVLTRRWTLEPDALERRRASVKHVVRAIDSEMSLAGGNLRLVPIDGVASEGALMVYFPADRFLYAGDYIQPGSFGPLPPGFFRLVYMDEVIAALGRSKITPETFAAMHVKLTPWSEAAARPQ